jgi:hypothetical protein
MPATESAASVSDTALPVLLTIGLAIFIVAAWLVIHKQRSQRVRERVPAGSELRGADSRALAPARPQPRSRKHDRLSRHPEKHPGRRPEKVAARKVGKSLAEPRLDGEVLLYGPWFSTVCHGYCGSDKQRFTVRAATVRGLRHRYEATPGQDALGLVWNPIRNSLFAVIADGLGSKAQSGEAARRAVSAALRLARRLGAGDDATEVVTQARHAVAEFNRTAAEGSTTLVLAELRRDRSDTYVATWGVGDSEAWLLRGDKWAALHHERRQRQENVTRHLPSGEPRYRENRAPAGSIVLLSTDGFASALGPGSRFGDQLARAWQRPPVPGEFLSQVDFEDDQFTDDRAALAVWIP